MWFYNRFKCTNVIELTNNNPIHTIINGRICYLAYFRVGERGIFLYESDYGESYERLHRVVTSIVQGVTILDEKIVTVTTEHTIYTFEILED